MWNTTGDGVKLVICGLALTGLIWASGPDYERAYKLYQLTEFQESVKILETIPNADASVIALMGRDYYGLGEFKRATEILERAVARDPGNSDFHLWLGRAYGRRAETSNLLMAPGYAKKAHQHFETAVRLNPMNLDAQSDLFEYYLEAPGFLGGGYDKAVAKAADLARINPAEGYSAEAKLAENRKQYTSAEAHLRHAIEAAPHSVGRLIELARFFTKQGRYQEADQSLAKADEIAPNSPKVIFAKADLYIKGKRNLTLARQLLQRYLSSELTPDDPPRIEAEKLLKQVQGS
jgi:tetratricopeptide (TPR) repeat protein